MSEQYDKPSLLLLGIGGAGSRLAVAVRESYGAGIKVVTVDTDAVANRELPSSELTSLLIGGRLLSGQGAGGDQVKARMAAQDDFESLAEHLEGVRTVVVVTGLGAGTGSGATPEIIRKLRERGISTMCVATLPFSFEGGNRLKVAERALPIIEEHADTLVAIRMGDLYAGQEALPLESAIRGAESKLCSIITLLWRLVTKPGFIRTDPERLHAQIRQGGVCGVDAAAASGSQRVTQVLLTLFDSPLLGRGERIATASTLMLGIIGGADLRLQEIGEVMEAFKKKCSVNCYIEMGTVLDQRSDGVLEVVVMAFDGLPVQSVVSSGGSSSLEPDIALAPPVAEVYPIQSGSRRRKSRGGSKLSFGATGRGRFQNVEPTIIDGVDYDLPTYQRRKIVLDR